MATLPPPYPPYPVTNPETNMSAPIKKMGRPSKQPEDMSDILDQIRDGKSHKEISTGLGVSHGTLCGWLSQPEHFDQSARAMLASAEAWLDRGLDAIEHNEDAHRGRYIAQECARRAGIRNMHYRERMGIDAKVSASVTIQLVNFADLPSDTDTE